MKEIIITCDLRDSLKLSEFSDLQPKSFKEMSKADYNKFRLAMTDEGFFDPIGIWKDKEVNWIIDGHHRIKILKEFLKDGYVIPDIPVFYVLCKNRKDAIRKLLLSNSVYAKITSEGLNELLEVNEIELDIFEKIELQGHNIELDKFLQEFHLDAETENEDDIPEVDESKVITQEGDLWTLGRHRLLCGDCTNKENVDRLMGGDKADMVFTDPPYGVNYADKNKFLNTIAPGNRIQVEIKGDSQKPSEMKKLWVSALTSLNQATKEGGCYYICSPQGGELMMMMMAILEAGWELKHCLIWAKNNHVLGRSDYNYKHEPILYGWKSGAGHKFYGNANETSLWEINKPLKNDLHPTMKPVELVARAINNSSLKNEIIIDGFLGSGTTIIAAEKTNRICLGMEIDPQYCDVILKRYVDFTGDDPVRQDGIKWSELK